MMAPDQDFGTKGPADNFGEMLAAFAGAMGELFKDPALQDKSKEFVDAAIGSAKLLGGRFEDEEVRARFRDVGKAAQAFGRNLEDYFQAGKDR